MRINRAMSRIGVFVAAMARALTGTVMGAAPASATHEYLLYNNKNSGKCLDVFAFNQDNGGNVVQWDYWNGPNQQWLREDPDGTAGSSSISRIALANFLPRLIIRRRTVAPEGLRRG